MGVMKLTRGSMLTSEAKPLSIANDYYHNKSVAAAVERASESVISRVITGTLAAGDYLIGVIPRDCVLVAVKIKATTKGTNSDATIAVKVGAAGAEAAIHTARAIDGTGVLTPTLTTTTASADNVVIATYVEDTGAAEAANVLVELVIRMVDDAYNTP